MNKEITVILNGYKRGDVLDLQIDALNRQTVKPKKIMLWYNCPPDGNINYSAAEKISTAISNENLGVWARFAYALNAATEYICVFDDDMVPGERWLENCTTTMEKVNGLLGGIGLLYKNPNPPQNASYYDHYTRYGWNRGFSDEIKEVDLVGHAWFFRREWLSYYWRELPDPKYFTCGEDMHFSYMLQKYAGIKTYVPSHPANGPSMWANTAGIKYAADRNSMWETNQVSPQGVPFKHLMNEAFVVQRRKGWKLINEK